MDFKFENDLLTIYIEGRIDSSTAASYEAKIKEIFEEYPDCAVVFDADKLEYISSSGLRIFLSCRKKRQNMKIINVSRDIYEVFEVTGFTQMIDIQKAYRKLSVDGCEVIGEGAKGKVYRYDPETVVKVYKNPDCLPIIQNERKLAQKAFVLGIPTAISYDIVKVGENYGSVFELLDCESFSKLIKNNPDNIEEYVNKFTDFLKVIHSTSVDEADMGNGKHYAQLWVNKIKDVIPEDQFEKIQSMLDKLPEVKKIIHCDYQTNNLLMQNGEPIIIDMDTLSWGHPIIELSNVYRCYIIYGEIDVSFVENFIGFSYDLAKKLWSIFIRRYFSDLDEAKISEIEDKIKLLGYIHVLSHFLRNGKTDDLSVKMKLHCTENIAALISKVDSFDF